MSTLPISDTKNFLRRRSGSLSMSKPKTRTMYKKVQSKEIIAYNKEQHAKHQLQNNPEDTIAYYCTVS